MGFFIRLEIDTHSLTLPVAPNMTPQYMDCEVDIWSFKPNTFQYIVLHNRVGWIKDWPTVLENC